MMLFFQREPTTLILIAGGNALSIELLKHMKWLNVGCIFQIGSI